MKTETLERYRKTVEYIESFVTVPRLHSGMSKESLKRMEFFLNAIGNPHECFEYIHVTGTAGKGTVATTIHNALVNHGVQAGLVTSPFVTTTLEKFQVGNQYISAEDFIRITDGIKPVINKTYQTSPYGGPSYFEILLAIGLIYFKEQECEKVVMEVGCGGRFDYTNITGDGSIAVITNIDDDHAHIIGPTLKDIAFAKAGIIKPQGTLFTTETDMEFRKIFEDECRSVHAACNFIENGTTHHETNMNLVHAVLKEVGIKEQSAGSLRLPARFESIQNDPRVLIDGAHNVRKMKSTVQDIGTIEYENLHVIFGASENKNVLDMIDLLTPITNVFYITRPIHTPRIVSDPAKMAEITKEKQVPTEVFYDPQAALRAALAAAHDNDLILITGSFYLAGELRANWFPEEYILENRKSF